jgi:hypothetical protein
VTSRILGCAVVCVFVLALDTAHAWEEDKDFDLHFDCPGAPMNGADSLALRIPLSTGNDGSFAVPELVGFKGGSQLWIQPMPKADEVNAAKSDAQCKGKRGGAGVVIDIASQYPADHGWIMQRFRWDGHAVRKLGQWINH